MTTVTKLISGLALVWLPATSFAATIYASKADFLAQVAVGAYTETFEGLSDPSSGNFAFGAFGYTASATSGLYVGGGFLGTNQIDQVLTISFTSGNVKAFGANFFATNISDQFQAVTVTLNLSDGTSTTFTPTSLADSYRGFTSALAIASVRLSAPGPSLYSGLDNFTVGTLASPIPEPASIALMGGGLLALFARPRRRGPAML